MSGSPDALTERDGATGVMLSVFLQEHEEIDR